MTSAANTKWIFLIATFLLVADRGQCSVRKQPGRFRSPLIRRQDIDLETAAEAGQRESLSGEWSSSQPEKMTRSERHGFFRPLQAVFLNSAGGDLERAHVAEKAKEMGIGAQPMALNGLLAAMSVDAHDLIFAQEKLDGLAVGGLCESTNAWKPDYGWTQVKLAASLVLPVPVYRATCGNGHRGRDISAAPPPPAERVAMMRSGAAPDSLHVSRAPRKSAWLGPTPPPQWPTPGIRKRRIQSSWSPPSVSATAS
jgi:hypothetical protein